MIFPPWRAFLCLHLPIAKNMKVITVKTLQEDEEMKTLQCLHFPSFTHGVMTYILAIMIIMFIYSGIVVIWDPWILICHPPVSFVRFVCVISTMSGGKSKSANLKWQQCPQNEHYCYMTLNLYTVLP